ncbi:dockerin type I repeat-containing protein [uncultured Ruminococcus sp.]|uniref:dockerin type I repeat-containing protein n=1 Tax=uncultured Ruminococcus sp. TaxID=165186 RepID=UPI0025EEECAE|nr:dockerin type I repeat-containing protein [uncultured Ruminococcus sp.]
MKNSKIKKFFGRTLSVILTVFLLLGTIPIVGVSAAEVTSNFEYTLLDDGTIEVTRYVGTDSYAIIPEEIDGKPVTKVNEFCFYNEDDYNGRNYTVKSIFISKNIRDFSNTLNNDEYRCLNRILYLESINVDESNSVYSSDAGILFSKDFTSLIYYPRKKAGEEYIVPEYVRKLGRSAFSQPANLLSLKFGSPLEKVGYASIFNGSIEEAEYPVYPEPSSKIALFTWCEKLTKVYISKDVKWMNDEDFNESRNVTLYVYNNSYALNWAKEHDFAYVIMEETPIEKDLVDEGTGIKVKGTMDPDAALKVEKLENTFENSVATYDITLQKDGIAIQPDGAITIKIPSDVKDCKVMWLKNDGTAEDMNAKYTDGCYVFTTNHLSVYALVQNKQYLKGDANQDGIVNVNDVTYFQRHIAGGKNSDGTPIIDENDKKLFDSIDMNKDGKLDVQDITALQVFITENTY